MHLLLTTIITTLFALPIIATGCRLVTINAPQPVGLCDIHNNLKYKGDVYWCGTTTVNKASVVRKHRQHHIRAKQDVIVEVNCGDTKAYSYFIQCSAGGSEWYNFQGCKSGPIVYMRLVQGKVTECSGPGCHYGG